MVPRFVCAIATHDRGGVRRGSLLVAETDRAPLDLLSPFVVQPGSQEVVELDDFDLRVNREHQQLDSRLAQPASEAPGGTLSAVCPYAIHGTALTRASHERCGWKCASSMTSGFVAGC